MEMASIIHVAEMYARMEVVNMIIDDSTGPKFTNEYGYLHDGNQS